MATTDELGGPSRAALTCSPSSFVFDLSQMPSNRTMRLSNDKARAAGGGDVAFKVMTTNRDRYRVKPTTGLLQPGEHIDVLLILSTSDPLPADVSAWSKDKFMVKAVRVQAGSSEATIKDRWATAPASEVQQTKLGCTHRLPGQPDPEEAAPAPSPSRATSSELARAEPRAEPRGPTAVTQASAPAVAIDSAAPPAGRAQAPPPTPVEEPAPTPRPSPQPQPDASAATFERRKPPKPATPTPVKAAAAGVPLDRAAGPAADGAPRALS